MTTAMTRRTLLAGAISAATLAALPVRGQQDGVLYSVEIRNFKFNPATLEVRPGDRIRWTNSDSAPHDATGQGRGWKTRKLRQNQSAEITVTADMAANYFCSIHPSMRAKLVILPV